MGGIWRLRVSEANAESRLECVKLKTITEIRRSRTRDAAYIAECYLVLDSLSGWEPVERLKQRSDVVSLNVFISMSRTAQFCIRRRLMDRCTRPARKLGHDGGHSFIVCLTDESQNISVVRFTSLIKTPYRC